MGRSLSQPMVLAVFLGVFGKTLGLPPRVNPTEEGSCSAGLNEGRRVFKDTPQPLQKSGEGSIRPLAEELYEELPVDHKEEFALKKHAQDRAKLNPLAKQFTPNSKNLARAQRPPLQIKQRQEVKNNKKPHPRDLAVKRPTETHKANNVVVKNPSPSQGPEIPLAQYGPEHKGFADLISRKEICPTRQQRTELNEGENASQNAAKKIKSHISMEKQNAGIKKPPNTRPQVVDVDKNSKSIRKLKLKSTQKVNFYNSQTPPKKENLKPSLPIVLNPPGNDISHFIAPEVERNANEEKPLSQQRFAQFLPLTKPIGPYNPDSGKFFTTSIYELDSHTSEKHLEVIKDQSRKEKGENDARENTQEARFEKDSDSIKPASVQGHNLSIIGKSILIDVSSKGKVVKEISESCKDRVFKGIDFLKQPGSTGHQKGHGRQGERVESWASLFQVYETQNPASADEKWPSLPNLQGLHSAYKTPHFTETKNGVWHTGHQKDYGGKGGRLESWASLFEGPKTQDSPRPYELRPSLPNLQGLHSAYKTPHFKKTKSGVWHIGNQKDHGEKVERLENWASHSKGHETQNSPPADENWPSLPNLQGLNSAYKTPHFSNTQTVVSQIGNQKDYGGKGERLESWASLFETPKTQDSPPPHELRPSLPNLQGLHTSFKTPHFTNTKTGVWHIGQQKYYGGKVERLANRASHCKGHETQNSSPPYEIWPSLPNQKHSIDEAVRVKKEVKNSLMFSSTQSTPNPGSFMIATKHLQTDHSRAINIRKEKEKKPKGKKSKVSANEKKQNYFQKFDMTYLVEERSKDTHAQLNQHNQNSDSSPSTCKINEVFSKEEDENVSSRERKKKKTPSTSHKAFSPDSPKENANENQPPHFQELVQTPKEVHFEGREKTDPQAFRMGKLALYQHTQLRKRIEAWIENSALSHGIGATS
ncbi:hypothetical protein O181_030025 [Austropuccinia psidii MF-1]|uniref:Uncharacterized protein n=1 Tax=Austropuccinia psidii MF-1 TaxID=1389203 RepID=A0A9Q3CWD4_9BASI|nr:hypothetical protein [Austropuccinia psidii MF-1]